VCTLVDKDKSMTAMIQNDEDKEWMRPLLELRNDLDLGDDRHLRDFRRMSGRVQLFNDRPIPGPYTQPAREEWLRRVLEAQTWIRANGPESVRGIELVTLAELHEIRRIWVVDKHEIEDSLPRIYEEVTSSAFPGFAIDDHFTVGASDISELAELCGDDRLHFELVRELLDVERRHKTMSRRAGLFDALEASLQRHYFVDEDDALDLARRRREARDDSAELVPLPLVRPKADLRAD
jgi:DNA sulfur modification protein DndC